MFKKLFTLLVVVSMLFTMTYIPAAADDGNNSYTVTTKDGGTITIVTNSRTFNEASADETEGGWSEAAPVATDNVAKVGNTEYATIDEAIAAWTNGTTLTLLSDVTLSDVIKLSSTEYHILDLGTYTMTAASKKDAIQIVNNGRSSASYTLDIKADATNPGGITATGKTVVVTTGKSGVKDRPIIRFYNGVFNGSYVVKHSGSNGTNCPQFQFHGGVFNGTISTNRALNQFYGGTFNGSMFMSVDSSAYTLVAGGKFKNLSNSYNSTLNSSKFTIGSAKGVYDRVVYVDEDGYYVVTVAQLAIEEIEAGVATTPNTNNYFYYSKIQSEGTISYADAKVALEKNNTTSAKVTVYVDELDMAGISYKGTIVIPEDSTLKITNAPAGLRVTNEKGEALTANADGEYTTIVPPVKVDGIDVVVTDKGNNSYDVALGNGATWEEDTSVTMTFPAVDGAIEGDSAYVIHEHEDGRYIYVGAVNAEGKVVVANNVGFSTFTVNAGGLQEAINAAQNGDTIEFAGDITEELVTIEKASGVALTIDGNGFKFTGEFEIGIGENITIQNVNFVATSEISPEYFIDSMDKNSNCVLTIKDCTFTDTDYTTTAVGTHQPTKVVVDGCTATGVASLLQNQGGYNITVKNSTVEGKRGMSLGTVIGASVENVKINAANDKYGIRLNGENANNTITIKDCEISAYIPVVVRKATVENYTIVFDGTNTMTPANADDMWCVIGVEEYGDVTLDNLTDATGKVTVTLNDTGLNKNGLYGNYAPTPSGSINGGLVNLQQANRTFLTIESYITYANESIVIKVYDANGTLLATASLVDNDRVILGKENWGGLSTMVGINCTDEWWNVVWEDGKLRADYVPAKATLFVDGVEMNTATVQMCAAGTETAVNWADVPGVPGVPVASVNGVEYTDIQEAIKAAQNGDVVTILPGEYGAINISNKNITIQGTVGENGELLTTIKGGDPAITGHSFNGTIKDLKIVDAWKVMYAEPAGNVTIDNVYVTGATYGFHLVAYSEGLTWTIQNSYMDLSWANSFGVYGKGDAAIVIKGNKFVSTSPYYEDYGALHVNTFLPNVTVEDNVFGENAKIALNLNDTSKINISNNYHADGVDNAFVSDSDATVFINEYYADEEMTQLVKRYVQIGENYYESFEAAAAVAQAGDEIILLADVAGDITVPAGVIFNGNGKRVNGIINASGVVTFAGITKAADLDVMNGTTVNIPAGASLQLDGSNRVSIGLGCTFNITGTITDAKTADKATITPSLIMPGASFTGAGVTFNVTNAYVKVPSSYASSSKSASGTFDFNIINSIWESAGKLAFESQSVNATVNFELKDSVLTTGSHLIFGVSRGEIVIDNSNVNVGTSRQIENQSTITIKNGSVVNGAVATSSNAKNPGTIIVDNATYAVTGEFSGSDLGTGTLILKNGAIVSAGSITKANIKIDATGMQVGDEINLTANLSKLVGTVEVINNGKLDAQIVDGKIVLVEKTLSGSGTEADPYQIGSVEDLILFRDSVNAGETKYSAPGVYTVLTADIDLAGINWIGIGSSDVEHGYMGNFNGNGYTIKNLTITNPTLDSDGYAYAGLFSITEGTDKNNQNVIKNLIIENVTISTTGHIVAAAIAYPYYTVVENVKVCGDINITGGDYTAGVLAYTRRCVNATGLSVVGNAGSAITGRYTVGGVISDIQMNGGLVAAYSNFSVEGVTVTGANNVGGISGIIASQTLDTCSVKNVTLVCKNNVGIVSGSLGGASTISGVVYENVSGATDIIGAVYDGATDVQAMIGDVYYATLEAALAAAKAGDTITLLTPYVVKAGETLTIDKDVTISATHGSEYAMIHVENGATMNLNNGKITYAAGGNNIGAAVWVEGALVQNGGTIEVTGSWTLGFGVDLRPNAWGTAHTVAASFVMNGGKIVSSDTAVRVASNSSDSYEELGVKFTMNGGEIESAWDAIFVQHLYAGDLDIVIVDGTVTGENSALRIYGNAGSDIDMNVAGGTFNGSIKVADAYVNADAIAISGGTFTEAVAEAYCADGYIPKDNGDGTYSVKIGSYAAIINGVKYESIAEAIKAAQNGDVVTILPGEYGAINISNKNITIQGTVGENGELLTTIKGGDPAITGHSFNGTIKDLKIVDAWKVMYAEPAGNVTIDNVYVTGATYGFHLVAYSEGLTWTIQNSYMDLSWANSFGVYGKGDAAIVIKGNKFVSTSPYYEDYGALHVNTFLPNVTVEDNVFGENAKIALNLNDTSKINISNNYHADGVDNAFVSDSDATVFINEYYADEEMTQLVKRYVQIGENYYESFEAAAAVAQAGDKIILLADAEIAATTNIDKSITIDGNGYKITQAEGFAANGANVVFDIFGGATVTFENLTFDAIKNVGIIRTVSANLVMNNCTIQNCEQTVSQGLLRLACGNATITNSKFLNNDCKMTLTFGYDAANDTDVLLVDSCTFEGNTCGETAVLYFADGAYGKVTNTKFIDNTVSSAGNAATLYMGWGEGFEVSGCLFDGNKVTTSHATTKRFASAIFADGCKIENNAFLENTAIRNGEIINTVVAVAAYYGEASVSDNYWKGGAPAYTVEYSRNDVEANGYYKDYNTETGELSNYVSMVAKVGQYTYASLAEAFKAATDGGTVTLLSDVALMEGITIPADANVTLDLAGHTIIGTPAEAKAYAVITNKGNLTINDSVGDGKIVCNHTLEGSTAYAVNTIVNSGKLTLKAGTIENVSTASNQIGYSIDNNSTSFDAILVVEGGKIVVSGSNYYDGVRLFCNSESKENSITVSGGEVSSIWLQNPSDGSADRNTKDVVGSVIITGGKVSSLYLEPSAKFEASITGGEIGSVGYFEESEGRNLTDFITGGIFSSDPSEFCAPLYHAPYVDGKYAVEKNESIVAIVYDADGNVLGTYDNLRDALEALGMEDLSGRIVLEKDTTAFSLQVFEGITLDLNGYTLETKYITVFNGGYLVDTSAENTGLLKCAKEHTAIQTNVVAENGVMSNGNNVPVWDEAKSGYIFTDYIFTGTRLLLKTEGEVSKLQYEFAVFTEKYARQLLKDGASDNDLSIIVRISWTKGDTTYFEDVRFSDNSVGTVIGENGANKKVFGLLVSNYEGFENLAFQAVILSGTEMVASTAPVAASSAIVSE